MSCPLEKTRRFATGKRFMCRRTFLLYFPFFLSVVLGQGQDRGLTARVTGPLELTVYWNPPPIGLTFVGFKLRVIFQGDQYDMDIPDYLSKTATQYAINQASAPRFRAFYTGSSLPVQDPISVGEPYQFNIVAFNATRNEQPWCCSADMAPTAAMCIASRFCAQSSPEVKMYQLPGIPTGLTLRPAGNKILRADWVSPAYTGGQRDKSLEFEVRIDGSLVPVSNRTFFVTPQYPEGTYHVLQVRAVNYAGPGDFSSEQNNISLLLPSTPLMLSASVAGEGIINVAYGIPSFTGFSNATWPIDYYILRVRAGQESYLNMTIGSNLYRASVAGLVKGVLYTFYVSAVNWAGEGDAGAVSQVAMYRASGPQALRTVTTAFSAQLQVSWEPPIDVGDSTNASSKIFNYTVVLYKPNTPPCVSSATGTELLTGAVRVAQAIVSAGSFTFEGLEPSFCYSVTISGNNAASRSGVLSIINAVPVLLPFKEAYVNLSSNLTGAMVVTNLTFVTFSRLSDGDMIALIFPPTFSVQSLNLDYMAVEGRLLTSVYTVRSGGPEICGDQCLPTPMVLFTPRGGGVTSAGSRFQLSFSGMRNPASAGSIGTFQLKTLRSNSFFLIDASLSVLSSPQETVPGRIDAQVSLSNPRAGATSYMAIDISCPWNEIPPESVITFVLPARMIQGTSMLSVLTDSCPLSSVNAGVWPSCLPPMSGLFDISSNTGRILLITRTNGLTISAGQRLRLIIGGVENPDVPGSTGSFQIALNNSRGSGMIASNSNVSPVFIWPMSENMLNAGGMETSLNSVQLSSLVAGNDARISLLFTADSICSIDRDGGSVIVELPDSFQPIGEPTISLVTMPASRASAILLGTNTSEPCIGSLQSCLGISRAQCFPRYWMTCWVMTFQFVDCGDWGANTNFNLSFGIIRNSISSGNVSFRITSARNLWSSQNVSAHSILGQSSFTVQILPNQLLNPTIQSQSGLCETLLCGLQLVRSTVPIILTFTTSTGLPSNFSLQLVFGGISTYSVSQSQALNVKSLAPDGDWTIASSSPNSDPFIVLVNRTGIESLPKLYNLKFNVTGLQSGNFSGSSGPYSMYIRDSLGRLIELNTNVPPIVFKYQIPIVSQFFRMNGPTTGGVLVTIIGNNYGQIDINPRLGGVNRQRVSSLGISTCQSTVWRSDSSLNCLTQSGVSAALQIGMTIENRIAVVASMVGMFSFDSPSIARVSSAANALNVRSNLPSSGGSVLVTGGDYGTCDYTSTVRVQSACLSSIWTADSAVSCRTGLGFAGERDITVTVGRSAGTLSDALSFDMPVVRSFDANAQVAGGKMISLFGSNFGSFDSSSKLRVGSSACQVSMWTSDTAMACKTGPGFEQNLVLMLSTGNRQVSTMALVLSYDLPIVLSAASSDMSSNFVTLNGVNFGVWDNTLQVDMSPHGCATTSWISDSSLVCALRAGLSRGVIPDSELKQSIYGSYVCKNCAGSEGNFLIGCEITRSERPRTEDVGRCRLCESCPAGSSRIGCDESLRLRNSSMLITGGEGTCLPCQSAQSAESFPAKFKTQVGTWQDVCQDCTQCGGKNQDGSAYFLSLCNDTHNAVCRGCPPCPRDSSGNLQVRVGCSSLYEGQCAMVDLQVGSVLATAAAKPSISVIDASTFVISEPLKIELDGDYAGSFLSIPAGLTVTISAQQLQSVGSIAAGFKQLLEWFAVTVVLPGNDMMSTGSSDGADVSLYSSMLYVSPDVISLSDQVNLTFLLFPNATTDLRRAGGAPLPLSLFSWDTKARTWVRIRDVLPDFRTGRSATAGIDRFGTYVLASRAQTHWPWWWWLILFFLLLVLLCICFICLCLCLCCKKAKKEVASNLSADPAFSHRKIELETPTSPPVTEVLRKSPFQLDDSYLANSPPETAMNTATRSQKVEVVDGTYMQDSLASQTLTRVRSSSPPPVYLAPSLTTIPRSPLPTQAVNQLDSIDIVDSMNAPNSLRSLNPRPPAPNHALQTVDDGNVYVSGGVPGKISREFDSIYARRDISTRAWNSSPEEFSGGDALSRPGQSYMGQSPRVLPFTVTTLPRERGGNTETGIGTRHLSEQNVDRNGSQSDWC